MSGMTETSAKKKFQQTAAGGLSPGWLAATLAGRTCRAEAIDWWSSTCRLPPPPCQSVDVKSKMYSCHLIVSVDDHRYVSITVNPDGTMKNGYWFMSILPLRDTSPHFIPFQKKFPPMYSDKARRQVCAPSLSSCATFTILPGTAFYKTGPQNGH